MAGGSPQNDVKEVVPPASYVCIPGDAVLALGPQAVVGLGTGLYSMKYKDDNGAERAIVFSKYCAPVSKEPHPFQRHVSRYSVESPASRRYLCRPGDPVIGIVIRKLSPHYYYLYIGGTGLVYMDALAFDGATKTSNPRLAEGALVYGFIVQKRSSDNLLDHGKSSDSHADDEGGECCADSVNVEMSCAASQLGLPPKEWTSDEAIFGPLQDGRLLTVPLSYAKSLLVPWSDAVSQKAAGEKRNREEREEEEEEVPASYMISVLGKRVPFEICIGYNGMVWVKGQESTVDPAAGIRRTIAVAACIMEGQNDVTKQEMTDRVNRYFPQE